MPAQVYFICLPTVLLTCLPNLAWLPELTAVQVAGGAATLQSGCLFLMFFLS